ncbi:MAG: AMP-binding protein, partial [Bacteroidia bacterium]|nr:AMP-binding protein [Bacteroidia bacterium]
MINNLIPIEFDPFSDDGNDLILPTTDPQQEIFTNILIGGKLANCAYNESVSLIFTGKFRYEIFVRSVNELIKRYHSLRCKFSTDGTSMTILTELTIEVPLIDLTALDSKKQTKAVEEIISGEMNQEFNIFTGPLIRVSVLQLSTEKTQVVLTLHHLIADGWSVGYCMIDLGKFYTAFCTEHEPELEKAESWPDFLNAESEYRKSNEHKLVTQFWLNEFKDSIPVFDLPINKPRPAFRTYEASRIDLLVDAETVKKIKQLGARCGCSFVNTMIAVFEVFLHRICSTNELVTMLPTAGQSVTGFEALIGHCVNLIPLKTSIQDSQSFSEYLKDRKKTLLDQLDHQRISLGELIREINLKRDPSRVPFSPVTFNIDVGMTNHVSFHNLEMEFITNPRIAENSEWFVNCAGNGDTLLIEWTYNKNLFEKKLMELRIREFITLLESIAADPDSQIRYLNILPEDELNTLLIDWNSFFIDFPPGYTINRLFEEQVQQHPDKIALWHNGVQLTYRELDDKANQLAHYLIQQGFKEGMFCGICLERSIEMIIAIYSVMKAGGAYIPLDPAYPPARIEVILQDANAEFIITQSSVKEKISGHTAKEIVYDQLRNELTSQPVNKPDINDDEYRISYVIYTSGSTGKPKGVAIMHHSFISLHAWAKTVYSKEDIAGMLASTSICFDLSVFEMFFTLGFGGRLIIVENALSLAYLPAEINVTFISMVPSAVAELVKMDHGIPDSVKVMNLAGEALSTELVTQLYQATKAERIYDLYGPTEDTYVSTWALRKPDERATIGRPLANSQIYILDKNLQPVPIGVAGELHIGGEGLAKGYLNRE